jgi:hypothetical protein
LDGSITDSETTSFTSVETPSVNWPTGVGGPFAITFNQDGDSPETVLCNTRSGKVFSTLTRGYGAGGSGIAHAGVTIKHTIDPVSTDIANKAAAQTIGKVTTAEDILVATGSENFKRLPKGSNGELLLIAGGAVAWGAIPADAVGASQIAPDAVGASELADNAVDTAAIVDLAVTAAKIAAGTITASKIATDTITASQIAPDAVGASELADNAVDTAAIAAGAVSVAKLKSEAWTAQTPSLERADGGAITLGTSGVGGGAYEQRGRLVVGSGHVFAGTTNPTGGNTSALYVNLPVTGRLTFASTVSGKNIGPKVGSGFYYNVIAGPLQPVDLYLDGADGTRALLQVHNFFSGTLLSLGGVTSQDFDANNRLWFDLSYEAAT